MDVAINEKEKELKNVNAFRCVSCNKVSDSSIETNAEEVVSGNFYRDRRRNVDVCSDCQEAHEMQMSEYHIRDQVKFNKYYLLDD